MFLTSSVKIYFRSKYFGSSGIKIPIASRPIKRSLDLFHFSHFLLHLIGNHHMSFQRSFRYCVASHHVGQSVRRWTPVHNCLIVVKEI
jgi:hypothetical protein